MIIKTLTLIADFLQDRNIHVSSYIESESLMTLAVESMAEVAHELGYNVERVFETRFQFAKIADLTTGTPDADAFYSFVKEELYKKYMIERKSRSQFN